MGLQAFSSPAERFWMKIGAESKILDSNPRFRIQVQDLGFWIHNSGFGLIQTLKSWIQAWCGNSKDL